MSDVDAAIAEFIASQSALDDLERLAADLPAGAIRDDLRVLLPLWERHRYGYDPAARKHPPEALDRASVMSLLERIASLLVDDPAAMWAVVDTVEAYRHRDRSLEPLFWDVRADLLAGRTTWDKATEKLSPPEAVRLARTFDPVTLARIRYGVPAALAVLAKIPPATSDDDEDEAVRAIQEMRRQDAETLAALVEKCREDLLAGRMTKEAVVERVGLRGWTALCASLSTEELRRVLGDDR